MSKKEAIKNDDELRVYLESLTPDELRDVKSVLSYQVEMTKSNKDSAANDLQLFKDNEIYFKIPYAESLLLYWTTAYQSAKSMLEKFNQFLIL
ncbi:hypothetical protein [Capybara microvirus Cap3_SP_264]|nr:hypothetical protein [Capybara microvirus Cap3_SP_264]